MIIKKAVFKNFRNIKELDITPHSKMNIIYGENGQGKTNVLEGLWLFSGAKSFRGAKDKEMVMFGEQGSLLNMDFFEKGTEKSAKITILEKRQAEFLGKKLQRPSLLAENFHAVVFSPSDLALIDGSPEKRRRFLDLAIGQIAPKYIEILRDYNRAILQRNALLKKISEDKTNEELLTPFEIKASESAEKILKYRYKYVELLNKEAPKLYSGISEDKEILKIEYVSKFKKETTKEEIQTAFLNRRKIDILAKTTTIGPKKDDLNILINEKEAKTFGSQGQRRSAALCLKLAEAEIMKGVTKEEPVAFLDDVMSELDTKRQNYILNKLLNKQVFITCCDKDNFQQIKDGFVFKMEDGKICSSI